MEARNAIEEKLLMFVIDKSKTTRCLKHIKNVPCKYKSQKKSWVDSQIFEEWVHKLNQTFQMEGRKIALLIDNCPAHPFVSDLTIVQLVFLPPNNTSVLQPTDQGVIRSLKAHYRARVVRRLCRALDKTKTLPEIPILQAMKILVSSWEAVSTQTIVNCFRKAGITPEAKILLSQMQMIHFPILKKVNRSCMTLTQIWFHKVLLQKVSLMLTTR